MNNPYLLKSKLKENEEELASYLRDMNIWNEQMKRKEHPRLVKNFNENKKPKTNHSKSGVNKISSWDYSAWDKFDVDKACEEVDLQNKLEKNESDGSNDDCLNNTVQSKLSEALYEKILGNASVQKQKWSEAILRYTRAIDYYDKDPVFYANRALCYLKTNEFKLAVNDCSSSLKLDSTYVKSYQRRCAAYMALGKYNEAKKDLKEILKLEPNNKQAKLDIEFVNNKIKQDTMQINSDITFLKTKTINNLQDKSTNSNILCQDVEKSVKCEIPKWPSRVACKQINSKPKPPHLRSKKPFYLPKIKDVQVDQEELDTMNLLQTTLKEVCEKNKKDQFITNKVTIITDTDQIEKKPFIPIPSPPQTYVQLKQDWAYLQKDSKLLFKYLKQIPGRRLPLIVRNSMDNDLFVDILKILKLEFVQNGHDIIDYLIGISELPRLQMLVMFCSDSEVLCKYI
ncbi:Hypothetical protein CINCED_3A001072 [Cinara cedri]|uniref:RNA polymerase II-associated protein 3 n=1 Tax=Cinara cedri TaxID=506608 RepID=A0A5E4MEG7_9HEMI|nr:Hypothetical protein CINCED_3A001072 [Cinara cedri]